MNYDKLNELDADEIMALPMEDVMAIPLEWLNDGYEPVTEDEREALFALLGKPTGVGLPNGLMGELEPGLNELILNTGDYLVDNTISNRGVGKLVIARLGSEPACQAYRNQIEQQGGKVYQVMSTLNKSNNVWIIVLIYKMRGGG